MTPFRHLLELAIVKSKAGYTLIVYELGLNFIVKTRRMEIGG